MPQIAKAKYVVAIVILLQEHSDGLEVISVNN